jgi:hypothetical protein
MRTLPNIAGTVANWPFNGSLVDVSGNGLTQAVLVGSALYETMDACTQAFTFDGANGITSLLAPLAASLQLAGEFTIQCIFTPRASFVQTIVGCSNNGNTGILYEFYVDTGDNIAYADQHVNTNITTGSLWTGYAIAAVPIAFTFRRRQTSPGNFVSEVFNGPTKLAGSLATTSQVPVGTERFFVGGTWGGGTTPLKGAMANMRVLNFARADADIATDAAYTLGSCLPTSGSFTVTDARAFVVGDTYQSQIGGITDLGTVTVTAINLVTNSITGNYNGGWFPQVAHDFIFNVAGNTFSLEALGVLVGVERGLGRLPPTTNRMPP